MTVLRSVTVHVLVETNKGTSEAKFELGANDDDETVEEFIERVRAELDAMLD